MVKLTQFLQCDQLVLIIKLKKKQRMLQKLIFFHAIFSLAMPKMMLLNSTICQGLGCSFVEIQSFKSHYVTLTAIGNTGILDYWATGAIQPLQQYITLELFDMSQIRSSNLNQYSNNRTVIQLNSHKVFVHKSLNPSEAVMINFSTFGAPTIFDACFGSSLNEIFILMNNYGDFYTLHLYNGDGNFQIQKNLTVPKQSLNDKMICLDGKIVMSFQNQLLILAANSSMDVIQNIPLSACSKFEMDFMVNNGILAYCCLNELTIVNLTNYQTLFTYVHSSNLTSVQLYDPCFIIFSNITHMFQFDYEVNQLISEINLQIDFPQHVRYTDVDTLIVSRDFSILHNSGTNFYFYNISKDYPCVGCSSCISTYQLDPLGNNCIKSISNPNFLYSTNQSNLTSNCGNDVDECIQTFFMSADRYFNQKILQTISTILFISSLKISPQLLVSLCLFFDDLWFYSYHQNTQNPYPQSVTFFLQKVNIISIDKINPWFLKLINFLNQSTSFSQANNQLMIQYLQIKSIQQSNSAYFTKSLIDNYRNNFLVQIFIFLFIKLICTILNSIQNGPGFFRNAYTAIKTKSNWWVFSSSLVQACIAKIAFDFSIQIQLPSFNQISDKLNFTISICVFFLFFSYIYLYYVCIFIFIDKKQAELLLTKSKYKSNSFIHQPLIIYGRIILRSFIHGYFLKHYTNQIFLLFFTDILFLFINVRIRADFNNKTIFLLDTIYVTFFGIFDLFFFLQNTTAILLGWKRELFGLIVICILILISILVFFFHLVCLLISLSKNCWKFCYRSKIKKQKRKSKSQNLNSKNSQVLIVGGFKRRSKTQKSILINMNLYLKEKKRITPFLRRQLKFSPKEEKKSCLKQSFKTLSTKSSLKSPPLKKISSLNSQYSKVKKINKVSDYLQLIYNMQTINDC